MTATAPGTPLGPRLGPLDDVAPHPYLRSMPPRAMAITSGTERPRLDGVVTLPIGPDRWLLVIEDGGILPADTVDVSHGLTRIRLIGAIGPTALSSGLTLDLHPDVFTIGTSAATAFRGVFVVLHRAEAAAFDLYTARSTALDVWEWLVDAAAGLSIPDDPGGRST